MQPKDRYEKAVLDALPQAIGNILTYGQLQRITGIQGELRETLHHLSQQGIISYEPTADGKMSERTIIMINERLTPHQFCYVTGSGKIPGQEFVERYGLDPMKCIVSVDMHGCLFIFQDGPHCTITSSPDFWRRVP